MTSLLRWLGLRDDADVAGIARAAWHVAEPMAPAVFWAIVAVGVALALLNFLPWIAMRRRVRVYTFILRMLLLGVVLVIAQQVELHLRLTLNEKPTWVVMIDDSASMRTADVNGEARFDVAVRQAGAIGERVGERVQLRTMTISGQAAGDAPTGGATLIGEAIERAALRVGGVDRVVLLTDGRDSEGRDLSDLGRRLAASGVQLDAVTLGDDVAPRDAALIAEPAEPVVRLGDELKIVGSIIDTAGAPAVRELVLQEDGKVVRRTTIEPHQAERFVISHRPEKAGVHTYSLELVGEDDLAANNTANFEAHVVDQRIAVLMIEGFPRFEFKLFKAALEVDPLVDLVTISHLPGGGAYVQGTALHRNAQQGIPTSPAELFKYDVIILRDVSRAYFREGGDVSESRLRNIVEFVRKRGGGLIATGGADVYKAGGYEDSALAAILPFDLSSHFGTQAHFDGRFYVSVPTAAYAHPLMQLLPDAQESRRRLMALRELDGSNNVGRFKPAATPLLTRALEPTGDATHVPIMAYMPVGEGKVVATATDTMWRWQLQPDYDQPPLAALLANMVRYLAPPPSLGPDAPTIRREVASPQVGQTLTLTTVLKDEQYDPIRHADLTVTVTQPDGSTYRMLPRDMADRPGVYAYRIALDQAGRYEVVSEYENRRDEASFVAGAATGEYADLSADPEAMARLARAAGGDRYDSAQAMLDARPVRPLRIEARRDLQVWNSPLLLVLGIVLISADCYVRKRQGLA